MVNTLISKGQKLFSRQQSNILSAAVIITGSSFLSALLGLLRNRLLVGRFFGSEVLQAQLDAYWVAFRMPELAFQLLVIGTVSAALIPVFNKQQKKSDEEAFLVMNSMMNIVLLIYIALSVFIFIFAVPLNDLITSHNFSASQVQLAAQLTRIMLLAQLFFAVSNFITGMIQAHQRFLIPALSPMAYNIGIIAGIVLLSPLVGIYGAAIGVVVGALLHLGMQIPLARRLGYRYSLVMDLKHPGVKEMIRMSPPRTLTLAVNQLELLVSVYFATALSAGSLTIVNLSQQLMTAPTRIFSVPLGQASLPFLSKQIIEDKMEEYVKTVHATLQHIFFLAFPAGMLLLILRVPLVRIAYGARDFPWAATLLTGKSLAILSVALFAQGGIHLLVRAYYAMHDTVVPFIIAVLSVLINILLSYLGVYVFHTGVLGLAAAVSISTIFQFVLLFGILVHRLEGWDFSNVLVPTAKIVVAALAMALSLWIPMRFLDLYVFDTTRTVPLIILTVMATLSGGIMYLGLARMMNVPEYEAYIRLLKRLGNWREVLEESEEVMDAPTQSQETTSY